LQLEKDLFEEYKELSYDERKKKFSVVVVIPEPPQQAKPSTQTQSKMPGVVRCGKKKQINFLFFFVIWFFLFFFVIWFFFCNLVFFL
jgi:hypothetical protein